MVSYNGARTQRRGSRFLLYDEHTEIMRIHLASMSYKPPSLTYYFASLARSSLAAVTEKHQSRIKKGKKKNG